MSQNTSFDDGYTDADLFICLPFDRPEIMAPGFKGHGPSHTLLKALGELAAKSDENPADYLAGWRQRVRADSSNEKV